MAELEMNPEDFMRRAEANEAFRALRREMGEVKEGQAQTNALLTSIIQTRTDEARNMGALQSDVKRLQQDVEILRKQVDQPRTAALSGLWDLLKLVIAAGVGWALSSRGK